MSEAETPIGSGLTCRKCRHTWNTRTERRPVQCPRCKSTTWDRQPRAAEAAVAYSAGERTSAMEMVQTGSGEWTTSDELWRRQRAMGLEDLIDASAGWSDNDKTVDEMLAEIKAGWRILDVFGEDEADEVSS